MRTLVFVLVLGGIMTTGIAADESPYKGQEMRGIKSLSQQQVDGYLNGRGMGYARAAELNNYPGPLHVLDLAGELGLDEGQISRTRAIYESMRSRAITLGKQLLEKEQELDRMFANSEIDPETLNTLVADAGMIRAKIRYVHLHAHLQQKAVPGKNQVELYNRLRGYTAMQDRPHHHDH